jgi:hypothetical protein
MQSHVFCASIPGVGKVIFRVLSNRVLESILFSSSPLRQASMAGRRYHISIN